jgi:hypothetical protein
VLAGALQKLSIFSSILNPFAGNSTAFCLITKAKNIVIRQKAVPLPANFLKFNAHCKQDVLDEAGR